MIYINYGNRGIFFENYEEIRHRENGPAVINGERQVWWVNGKLHRLDGPTVIDGNLQFWYINGFNYLESEYHEKLKEM